MIDTHEVEGERFEDQTNDEPEPTEESATDVERERLEWHPRRTVDDVEYFVRTQRHRRRQRMQSARRARRR